MHKSVLHYPGNRTRFLSPLASQDTAPVALASDTVAAYRVGQVDTEVTKVVAMFHVGTAGAAITWGEIGLAVGDPVAVGQPTLTPIGYADASADFLAGNNWFSRQLTMSRMPRVGEHLWILWGNVAGTPTTFRVANGSDGSGQLVYTTAFRPSTNQGVAKLFTLNTGVVALPLNCRLALNI